ncbi:hypothetical protein [Longispora albida]|nr:hypothetical protein [Longispora albida]
MSEQHRLPRKSLKSLFDAKVRENSRNAGQVFPSMEMWQELNPLWMQPLR